MRELPLRSFPPARGTLALLLLVALALRVANGALGSFWLDDFHSLHHARAVDLRAFFGLLVQDNHPPLSFLLLRGARAAFGESPWALRVPALLAGLGAVALTWRIGARLPCARGRFAATFLVAVSSLHVELSSDLRMYALLALASAGLVEGLLARLEDGHGAWRIALWTWIGLHAHYHFLYTLAAVGTAFLILVAIAPRHRGELRPVLGAFAAAALLALPWYALGFPRQLGHGLAPGGSNASILRLGEGLKSLVFYDVSVAGEGLRWIGLAGAAALLVLAGLGALTLFARARAEGRLALPVLLAASAFAVPALAWGAARLLPRAGYEWRYLAGALPAFCLLAGSEACASGKLARVRRIALAAVCAAATALALANARDRGEEDYRGAAAWVLAHATAADGIVTADWQPTIFPHGLGFDYYAGRGGGLSAERLAVGSEFSLADPARLAALPRVYCCLRSVPPQCALLRTLRAAFPHEETLVFGRSVFVHVFTR